MKKIAIIGSTGMLGQPVTQAFISAGYAVSLLARNPSKAKNLFGDSVRIVSGDVNRVDSLKELLQGQDYVYINLSVTPSSTKNEFQSEREGLKNILQAAKESNLQRVGYLSSLVHQYSKSKWWVFDIKREAVQQIKQSKIAYTIFYPSTFMESFDKGAYLQGNNLLLSGTSLHPMYLIAGVDYAQQVVCAFKKNEANHEYVVQGEEGFLVDDAAALFASNYAKSTLTIKKLPFGLLRFLGRFSQKLNYTANIIEALNNYPEKFAAQKTWNDLGKPKIKFLDYAKNS